ncbi:hypothetical protein BKA67DRAFT_579921 [Truncatella angustata]|uniref:UBC core domain-containing protein n=1 Tax=Truncatella angustata TaxID=152316 RepID=A0A9P8UBU1_9PEZI|nr:uncharacterized protein BKA67DRAFT_579921 [Truncatella angustata]KAH6646532.1 hypothetical protein BKA67DRAFT_579921 [Truncatella angustata]
MAEPIGTALGALGLAGLLSVCLDCFNLIDDAVSVGRDFMVSECQFSAYRIRLYAWGKACGFLENDGYDRRLDQLSWRQHVQKQLNCISLLFLDAAKLIKRYELIERYQHHAYWIPPIGSSDTLEEGLYEFIKRQKQTKRQAGVWRALQWAVKDKKAFQELNGQLKECIEALELVCKNLDLFEMQKSAVQYEVDNGSDISALSNMISSSRMVKEPDIVSEASSQRLALRGVGSIIEKLTLSGRSPHRESSDYTFHTAASRSVLTPSGQNSSELSSDNQFEQTAIAELQKDYILGNLVTQLISADLEILTIFVSLEASTIQRADTVLKNVSKTLRCQPTICGVLHAASKWNFPSFDYGLLENMLARLGHPLVQASSHLELPAGGIVDQMHAFADAIDAEMVNLRLRLHNLTRRDVTAEQLFNTLDDSLERVYTSVHRGGRESPWCSNLATGQLLLSSVVSELHSEPTQLDLFLKNEIYDGLRILGITLSSERQIITKIPGSSEHTGGMLASLEAPHLRHPQAPSTSRDFFAYLLSTIDYSVLSDHRHYYGIIIKLLNLITITVVWSGISARLVERRKEVERGTLEAKAKFVRDVNPFSLTPKLDDSGWGNRLAKLQPAVNFNQLIPSSHRYIKRIYGDLKGVNEHRFMTVLSIGQSALQPIMVAFEGSPQSPYKKGIFHLEIVLGADYPRVPPNLRLLTKIYHPNIGTTGKMCLSYLEPSGWPAALPMWALVLSIIALMDQPDIGDPLVPEIAAIYLRDIHQYYKNAQMYTEKYAKLDQLFSYG